MLKEKTMEVQELTKDEYHTGLVKLYSRARKLATGNSWGGSEYYYSKCIIPCGFFYLPLETQINFKEIKKRGVADLTHFMETSCDNVCKDTIAICYAKIRNGKAFKYFYCEHQIGMCPHKEVNGG